MADSPGSLEPGTEDSPLVVLMKGAFKTPEKVKSSLKKTESSEGLKEKGSGAESVKLQEMLLKKASGMKAAMALKKGKSPTPQKGKSLELEKGAEKSLEVGQSLDECSMDDSLLKDLATVNKDLWRRFGDMVSDIKKHELFSDIETATALDITDDQDEDSGFQDAYDPAKFKTAMAR